MCGIAGFVTDRPADATLLHRMCDALRHRGPDDDGYLVDGGTGLGMRRLSIIDLRSGRQPIHNEDGTVAVVYNGEIYNFPELRRRLESGGHRFATNTDTECIVHLYEEHGDRCVEHLRGMFAFALWDARRRRLLLARDRVGKKPLYYRVTADGLWFGSELKALVQDPGFVRRVDPVGVHHYLTYQYVPSPWTIFEGVRKLPPAHTLVYEGARAHVSRYWRLRYTPKLDLTEGEAVEALRELVGQATAMRLLSDRPVGAFLSGGVDSSFVVAAMAEHSSGPVRTFSIGFDDQRFDERRFARAVAERFGTDHHELVVRPSALDVLPALVWHYDEPFADASAIPSYYLAEMTRRHVTVALNGDGGDECFGGYERYLSHLRAQRWGPPRPVRGPLRRATRLLPRSRTPRSFAARGRRYLEILAKEPEARYLSHMSYFDASQKHELYTNDMRDAVGGVDSARLLDEAFAESDGPDLLDRVLSVDVETYLPGDLLVKMDRATMAHSLEARSPFLDHHVMEFAARLPSRLKVRRGTGKYLLKAAARGRVPDEVLDRPKMGFGVPLAAWLRGELRDLAHDALTDDVARSRGYFRPEAVGRLLAEHDDGVDHGIRVWALLQLELWTRLFVDGGATSAPSLPPRPQATVT